MKPFHPVIKAAINKRAMSLESTDKLARWEFLDHDFNLTHTDYSTWSKRLWQELFNIYVLFDCPLASMHDMLCDHDNIVRLLGKYDPIFEFYWYFDPGYTYTIFSTTRRIGEEFGLHIKQTEEGYFAIRHLFKVLQEEPRETSIPDD